jgi:hypothetical protein
MLGVVELQPEAAVSDFVSEPLPAKRECTRAGSHTCAHTIIHPVSERDVTERVVQIVVLVRCAHLESGSERV